MRKDTRQEYMREGFLPKVVMESASEKPVVIKEKLAEKTKRKSLWANSRKLGERVQFEAGEIDGGQITGALLGRMIKNLGHFNLRKEVTDIFQALICSIFGFQAHYNLSVEYGVI